MMEEIKGHWHCILKHVLISIPIQTLSEIPNPARKNGWGHVQHPGEIINAYKCFIGKPESK
jgi:hypothetical protein